MRLILNRELELKVVKRDVDLLKKLSISFKIKDDLLVIENQKVMLNSKSIEELFDKILNVAIESNNANYSWMISSGYGFVLKVN